DREMRAARQAELEQELAKRKARLDEDERALLARQAELDRMVAALEARNRELEARVAGERAPALPPAVASEAADDAAVNRVEPEGTPLPRPVAHEAIQTNPVELLSARELLALEQQG